jgi:hypothetical protein
MAEFTLKITLGNEAMQTGDDVKEALQKLNFERYWNNDNLNGCIRDINGNTIGSWMVK